MNNPKKFIARGTIAGAGIGFAVGGPGGAVVGAIIGIVATGAVLIVTGCCIE